MRNTYWFYLKNIFINPIKAAEGISNETHLGRVAIISFLIGSFLYVGIVLMGYQALGWGDFPYKQYYPNYFDPYWWEVFVNPIWGLVIAFGFGIPCYWVGKLLGGKGRFGQVITFVLLASLVSLPIMVIVDVYTIIKDPSWIIRFAETGSNFVPYESYPDKFMWVVEVSYAFVAMAWQAIVTLIGLTIIHRISWYKNVPGLILGNMIFVGFLLLIRDHVALII
jgi:hypothetical protein